MPALTFMKVSTAPFAMSSNVVPSRMRFSIIKQNRFRTLICEGYRYSRYMVVYNKEYWRCTDRSCKGKLHLSNGRIVFVKKNGHNHGPDHKGASADQALFVMRKRAYNEGTPFRRIYQDTVKEFEEVGHGPMRDLLPYEDCLWKVLNQVPGKEDKHSQNDDSTGSQQSQDNATAFDGNSEAVDSSRTNDTVDGDDISEMHVVDEQKPEVCELEVIDCTEVTAESPLSLPTSSSVTITTHPLNKKLTAALSTLAVSAGSPYNHSTMHNDTRRSAVTITSQGGIEQGSPAPALQIHSTYSLQPNSSTVQPEELQGIMGNPVCDVAVTGQGANSMPEAPSQHSGQRAASQSRETYVRTRPSSRIPTQVSLSVSQALGAQSGRSGSTSNQATLNTGNRFTRQRGFVQRNAGSRITAVRIPSRSTILDRLSRSTVLDRPIASQSFAEPRAQTQENLDARDETYQQLQMRLARKEHRVRLQYLKEQHDADMVLVHLQQELIREQLRDLRQPRGGVSS